MSHQQALISWKAKSSSPSEIGKLLSDLSLPNEKFTGAISKLTVFLQKAASKVTAVRALATDPKFKDYIRMSAARICGRIGDTEYFENNRHLLVPLFQELKREYQFIKKQGYKSEATRAAGRKSLLYVTEVHEESERVLGENEHTQKLIRTAVGLVFHGTYKSITEVKEQYLRLYSEAENKLKEQPSAKEVLRTIVLTVLMKNPYKTIDDAIGRYNEIEKEVDQEFKDEPEFASVKGTVVSMLFERKIYKTAKDALTAYKQYVLEATEVFGRDPETKDLIKTVAGFLLKRRFLNAEAAKTRYDSILESTRKLFTTNQYGSTLIKTIATVIFSEKYDSPAIAKKVLLTSYSLALKALAKVERPKEIARAISLNIMLGRSKNIQEEVDRYKHCAESALGKLFVVESDCRVQAARTIGIGLISRLYADETVAIQAYAGFYQALNDRAGQDETLRKYVNECASYLYRKIAATVDQAIAIARSRRVSEKK